MAKTQRIYVRNLDQMVEDVFGVGGEIFEPIIYEELEQHFTSKRYKIDLTHNHHFALFKLIHEDPKKAIILLEKTATNQSDKDSDSLKSALRTEKHVVLWGKHNLQRDLLSEYPKLPYLWEWKSQELLAIVKSNPKKSLKFFQECYEKIAKEHKEDENWGDYEPQILTMIEALKTRNFSIKGTPEHLELKITPKKERLEVPENINITNPVKLSRYLMQLEKASLKNVGLIENKAILIPRQGEEDWSKGIYIVTYDSTRLTDKVYKTEKPHTDEEIVEKTTGQGKIIKELLEKIALALIDLA